MIWGISSPTGTERRKANRCRRGRSNRSGPVLISGGASCSCEPRSPPVLGFPRYGAGGRCRTMELPVRHGARGAGAGMGRKGGLVTRRNITSDFLSPFPRMSLLPRAPVSAVRASPAALPQHPPHGTGRLDSAPLGVALGQRKELGKIRKVKSRAQAATPEK